MPILDHYFLFLAKTLTLVFSLVLIILMLKNNESNPSKPTITQLGQKRLDHYRDTCKQLKKIPHFKKRDKLLKKKEKALGTLQKNLFILDFKGDLHASSVEGLRQEIDLILALADKDDEVLIRLNSRGGTITGYGLAASQVNRLRKAGFKLTIAIDEIAASGGYLIAALASHIIAAPFACIGSIGVAYELPNLNKLLSKHGIEYTQVTAGKYKRTLSLFGENTKEGEKKVKEEAEVAHELFKSYISQYRDLDLTEVATGETWPAAVAHQKGLVDMLMSSDEFIEKMQDEYILLHITTPMKKALLDIFRAKASALLQHLE